MDLVLVALGSLGGRTGIRPSQANRALQPTVLDLNGAGSVEFLGSGNQWQFRSYADRHTMMDPLHLFTNLMALSSVAFLKVGH